MAHYSPLPTYNTDDVKVPLLSESSVALPIDGEHERMQVQEQQTCARRCGGQGFFGRMRSRCEARRMAKYGPPCDNPRCMKKARGRRIFRRIIFALLSLWLISSLAKFSYFAYTLPKHVTCYQITDTELSYDLPLTKQLFVDYSLTSGTTTIMYDDIPSDNVQIKVAFDSVPESDDGAVFCTAKLHRAVGAGVFKSTKNATLPTVESTTIVLPSGASRPSIKFGGKKAAHCAGKMVKKLIKWKGDEIME